MVLVRRAYCVDRYEAVLVHAATEAPLSPYYPPDPKKASYLEKLWRAQRGGGTSLEKRTDLPPLPGWQKLASLEPKAESREGAVPQGYASGLDAERACKNAGKRLCTRVEWRTACRGEQDRDFPYGERYEDGRCNVFREAHPGIELWGDPSKNHTDPRLNLVSVKGKSLLRRTGATPSCKSDWEGDALYDMVGNLDEWIDDPEGTFLGGFYARAKKDGCQSAVSSHGLSYADYSTGIRCCKDASPEG
jgi:formylglycine-generating enzyme required for sulfatase activity